MIVEGFGGPGGWAVALRRRFALHVGMELDRWACATRAAEGHPTIRCDVTQYPTAPFRGRITGKVDSPPCQAWSQSGHLLGLADQPLVHQAVEDLARGRDTRAELLTACKDPRSLLAAEPMRWHYDLRPEWIAMEEVPAVLPLWQQYAAVSSTSRAAMRAAMANPDHWAWRKPAPTVTGTVGHVGSKQVGGHLNLSIPEAARLQGFPDGYRFQGNKGQVSLQIGNAVPPPLAEIVINEAAGTHVVPLAVGAAA